MSFHIACYNLSSKRVQYSENRIVSRMGDKVHIIVPKAYYKDIDSLIDEFVDVEVAGPQ